MFQLIFMDQIEDVGSDLQTNKGENCIVIKLKEGLKESKIILTTQVMSNARMSTFDAQKQSQPYVSLWA